jgi:hypothetical protein
MGQEAGTFNRWSTGASVCCCSCFADRHRLVGDHVCVSFSLRVGSIDTGDEATAHSTHRDLVEQVVERPGVWLCVVHERGEVQYRR